MSTTTTERIEDQVVIGRQWFEGLQRIEGGACSVCQYPLERCGTCHGPRCHCLSLDNMVRYVHWSAGRPLQLSAAIMRRWGSKATQPMAQAKNGACAICHAGAHEDPDERFACENRARAQERCRRQFSEAAS